MAITYFGDAASHPDDASDSTSPQVVTPPGSMVAGDLVIMECLTSNDATVLSVSEAGGQSWTSETQYSALTREHRYFWCRYDGTWDASPSVASTVTGSGMSVKMTVFRPSSGSNTWEIDVASDYVSFAAETPHEIAQITTIADGALAYFSWCISDNSTLGAVSGTGWIDPTITQLLNRAGNDMGMAWAYKIMGTAGATGAASKTDAGPSVGMGGRIAFKEIAGGGTTVDVADIASSSEITDPLISRLRTISFASVQSVAQVASDSIERIRSIALSALSSASEITDLTLTKIVSLVLSDLSSGTSITQPAISRLRSLVLSDLSSSSELTDLLISRFRTIEFGNVESLSDITDPSISRIRTLLIQDLSSAGEITQVSVLSAVIKALVFANVSSSTQINQTALSRLRQLLFSNISSAIDITDPTLSRIRQLDFANLTTEIDISDPQVLAGVIILSFASMSSDSSVSSLAISRLRELGIANVESLSEITDVSVTTSGGWVNITLEGIDTITGKFHQIVGRYKLR